MAENNIQCCFCGPVRQCASFLSAVLRNIEKIGSHVFQNQYAIVVFYDQSTDASLQQLQTYKKQIQESLNIQMHLIVNPAPTLLSPYRTHRIAAARNACLALIKTTYPKCPYFIMMDFDDPNSKPCDPNKLLKYFDANKLLNQWDALSFQTAPHYYDIWALSIPPFSFSYNHLPNNNKHHLIIRRFMDKKLANTKQLVPCISAFNGFAIYKTAAFQNCRYSGDIRESVKQSKKHWIEQHKAVTNSPRLVFPDYGHIKGKHEDCEHRPFHMQAIKKHGAKIRISPEILFI